MLAPAPGAKWQNNNIFYTCLYRLRACVYIYIYIYIEYSRLVREREEKDRLQSEEERKGAKKGPVMIGSRPRKIRKQKRVHHPFGC